ncbi:hypothetical protein MTO96_016650 [Rhipicephalus appendiculatus]
MKTWMFEKDGGIQNHRHRELLLSDPDEYRRLLRLSCEQFTQLLALVGPMIDRQDTAVRRSISPATRLQVILRYLATGESHHSLSRHFRLGHSTVNDLLPETCVAIYDALERNL